MERETVAKKALEDEGWVVEDTSLGNPFDLLARCSGGEMHVEVKGLKALTRTSEPSIGGQETIGSLSLG